MINNTKILFSDLDGTLLNEEKKITQKNLDAIHGFVESGSKFVFVTGRPTKSGIDIAERYGLLKPGFFVVGYNGGVIYDVGEGRNIYTLSCSMEDMEFILKSGEDEGLCTLTYTESHVICHRESEALKEYCKGLGMPYLIVKDCKEKLKEEGTEPYKMIVSTLDGRELLKAFKKKIDPKVSERLYTLITSDVLLEIGPASVSKGKAIEALCGKLGIPIENSFSIGDESNDLSMIEAAGCGIAVANAIAGVKAAAGHITDNDNDHDAVAEAIEWIVKAD